MMISYDDLDVVNDIRSQLQIPLALHHSFVTVALQIQIGHAVRHDASSKNLDFTDLGTVEGASKGAVSQDEHMQHQLGSADDGFRTANDLSNCMIAAFHDVAHICLPSSQCKPQRFLGSVMQPYKPLFAGMKHDSMAYSV